MLHPIDSIGPITLIEHPHDNFVVETGNYIIILLISYRNYLSSLPNESGKESIIIKVFLWFITIFQLIYFCCFVSYIFWSVNFPLLDSSLLLMVWQLLEEQLFDNLSCNFHFNGHPQGLALCNKHYHYSSILLCISFWT